MALAMMEPPVVGSNLAVSCQDLVKEFGSGDTRIRVLRGVHFEARKGEVTFLVGPSGCGKTTLISVLAGLLTADSGEIQILGTNVMKLRGGRLVDFRAANIGFIFQQFNLLSVLTAVENASVPLLVQGASPSHAEAAAAELLDQLGLKEHKHKYPTQLSGGQQQRVTIARALVHQPKLVICDEPTASLDAQTGQTVMQMLCDLAVGADRSVIVVTHDNRIFSFADRIAHMSDGKITSVEQRTTD